MDMEKTEAEFEVYGCTLEELKKEYERLFRLHIKRMVEKFTNNVIDAAQRDLTVETANKIKSFAEISFNLVKPETIKFLSKFNGLIDRNFAIPDTLPMSENSLQNTQAMDDYEKECEKEIAELELVYKQQAVMLSHLKAELELYGSHLVDEANIDMSICNLFENNFTDSNFNAELVDNVVRQLDNIGIDLSSKN